MSIEITAKIDQAKGSFAGGLILENKPIGFPQDGGLQEPYSNLFYWANAWSDHGGLIGEHPHKMFEIMSFILEGGVEHYDSKFDRWLPLEKGDVQIIRSGSGITHAEKLLENSRIFQIWFDPNIRKTIEQEATYNDYKGAEMLNVSAKGIDYRYIVGNGGPVEMESEEVEVFELTLAPGEYKIPIKMDKIHSFYTMSGEAEVNSDYLREHDFIKIENEAELTIKVHSETKLFTISVPQKLSYKTYLEIIKK